jgi:DNA-binding response OmpR family regulator
MTADLGPLQSPPGELVRLPPHRLHHRRKTGADLLVVDPYADGAQLAAELVGWGLRVTCVGSTLDGLVELGRTDPAAVVVAPEAPGVPATEFVTLVRAHGTAVVIAALPSADAAAAGPLMLSGAAAAVTRPYCGRSLWDTLGNVPGGLGLTGEPRERVTFGPLEIDVRSYAVRVHGERLADLPAKEFELLRALADRAPDVVSNDDLRVALWGGPGGAGGARSDNTIAVHAARLRQRLDGVAQVRRVRGRGYSLTLA